MANGRALWLALILLSAWIVVLARAWWKLLKHVRRHRPASRRVYLNLTGVGLSTLAVGALLCLHLSWVSAGISQYLGTGFISFLSALVIVPAFVGLVASMAGTGRARWVGLGTSLLVGGWWIGLAMAAGITLGAVQARHPVRYLIPDGYVGWVTVAHEYGASLEIVRGEYICRIPAEGVLHTQSPLEEGWAKDEYFYYSRQGSLHPLRITGWGAGGMIWGNETGWQQTEHGEKPKWAVERFYVGTEAQFRRNEARPAAISPTR